MKHLINIKTKKIFPVKDSKITIYDSSKFAILPDDKLAEIQDKFYTTGYYTDEEGNQYPITVNLNLIESLQLSQQGTPFKTVESIIYKDRDSAIAEYEAKERDRQFKYKAYKVHIGDIAKFLTTPYGVYLNYCKEHPDIITEQYTEGSGESQMLKGNAYMNYIKAADMAMINNAVYQDGSRVFQLEIN